MINPESKLFEDDQLYPTKSVLEKAKIGLSTFNVLVSNGKIPCIRISDRIRRFKGSILNQVFSEQ